MRSIVVAVVLSLSAACGAARAPVATFAELPDSLNHGDTVTVVDVDEARWRGRVAEMTPDRLVVRPRGSPGNITLTRERIRQVGVTGDPLSDGVLAGLGIGAVTGLVLKLTAWNDTGSAVWLPSVLLGGIGAGLGAITDAVIRREVVVFRARPLTVGLSADPNARQVVVGLRW